MDSLVGPKEEYRQPPSPPPKRSSGPTGPQVESAQRSQSAAADPSSVPTFQRVQTVSVNSPPRTAGKNNRQWAAEYCQAAARTGINEIQINFLSLPLHPILMAEPSKRYHWFSHYAASLDMFCASRLFRGVYPTAIIAANFELMRLLYDQALRHGLKPFLYCAEPRFVPEHFFTRRPDLRGPRVDNPMFGTTPYYALCTDKPEVRAHYREMLTGIMSRLPQIATLSLFTTDSGSGFCHCPDLYVGPNGPNHCKNITLAQRVATFCRELIEVGRQFNSEFEVQINSNIPPGPRAEIAARKVPGLSLPIYGIRSWTGGLEEQWSYHQYRSRIDTVGRAQARRERLEDFRTRLQAVSVNEDKPWALCELPTIQYFSPIRYVPQPYDVLRVLRSYQTLGIRNVSLRGTLSHPNQLRFDVNSAVFCQFQRDCTASDEDILTAVLSSWNGLELKDSLLAAWADADESVQERPVWRPPFGRDLHLIIGPIVPDFERLTPDDMAYYDHVCFDEMQTIHGPLWYLPDLGSAAEYEYALRKYEQHTLPLMERACSTLQQLCSSAPQPSPHNTNESPPAQAIAAEQLIHLQLHQSNLTSQHHWVQMIYLQHGGDLPTTTSDIVAREIANTHRLLDLLGDQAAKLLDLAPLPGQLYMLGPNVLDQLRQRIAVMEHHQHDAPAALAPQF